MKKYFIRQSVESLLDQIDSRLIGVLDDFIKKEHIKGWTLYHDELDKYPIGEYNDHLRWIVVNSKDTPLDIGDIVRIENEDGWEYRVGRFIKLIHKNPIGDSVTEPNPNTDATFAVYEAKGCAGRNIPPEAWKSFGIERMNGSGFMDGDGVTSMKNPDTGEVYKPGEKCPICDLWDVETTLVQVPGRNPKYGYCPRQIIHRYSAYKNVPEMDAIVAQCKKAIEN